MENMQRLREDIKDYIMENGKEYDRLLVSEEFLEKLKEETASGRNGEPQIDLPRLEVRKKPGYDYKLI